MDEIDPLPELEKGRKQPYVRQSYKVLERAHSSVEQLFAAAGALEAVRREANSSKKGRKARLEVDILRSAIVMTSAGLDASMKRLVNDVGRELIVEKEVVLESNISNTLRKRCRSRVLQRTSAMPWWQMNQERIFLRST